MLTHRPARHVQASAGGFGDDGSAGHRFLGLVAADADRVGGVVGQGCVAQLGGQPAVVCLQDAPERLAMAYRRGARPRRSVRARIGSWASRGQNSSTAALSCALTFTS